MELSEYRYHALPDLLELLIFATVPCFLMADTQRFVGMHCCSVGYLII